MTLRTTIVLALALVVADSLAQSPPKTEFRGAWIATVGNLDWPPREGFTNGQYQDDLDDVLDGLAAAGINAVFFQVRSECDAMYPSPFEPWSYWLTGTQGRGPSPSWDPLEHAITGAHARGMTLHAWFNPFRCEGLVGRYPLAGTHPSILHPDWMLTTESDDTPGNFLTIMDPGKPHVRSYVAGLIGEMVRRYDVDGIHFDDYFYPYPPYGVGSEDLFTFAAFGSAFDNISDWRRDNINRFVAEVDSTIKIIDPDAVFGISPFGIWRSGTPEGISGLSGADALHADALAWLQAGTIDYIAPQLYWPFGGAQDFETLSFWWGSVSQGRHVYPGLASYRADLTTFPNPDRLYDASEVPAQIRHTRTLSGTQGHIHFRAQNLISLPTSGLLDSLQTDLYRYKALLPSMDWRDLFPPDAPENLVAERDGDRIVLTWDPAIFGFVFPRYYAVYRVETAGQPDRLAATADARNLIAITYEPTFEDFRELGAPRAHYVITALSRNHAESLPSRSEAVNLEAPPDRPALADAPFPNPFSDALTMRVSPESEVRVYDALGREVHRARQAGRTTFRWDGRAASGESAAPGVYLIVVEHHGLRVSFAAVRIR